MTFVEHNNREKANKFAEYVTGKPLREYLAKKVKQYCGENISVFDGAAGSGQLEQFISMTDFHAVEIQQESCEALKTNFPHAIVNNQSFFTYQSDIQVDAIAMNPPYSLKLKDLPEEDQQAIKELYPWKKSGVIDDIFLLKSMTYTKRYGFYIMFPGIAYRQSEKKMRELVGNNLVELNEIQNGFEDTSINVIFLVIDKEKNDSEISKEIYDCKTQKIEYQESDKLNSDFNQVIPKKPVEKEEIDIDQVNAELDQAAIDHLGAGIKPKGTTDKFNCESDTIRLTRKGTVGAVYFHRDPFWIDGDSFRVEPKEMIDKRYLFHWLLMKREEIERCADGNNQPGLSLARLSKMTIEVPDMEYQLKVVKLLGEMSAGLEFFIDNITQTKMNQSKVLSYYEKHLASQLILIQFFNADIDLKSFITRCHKVLDDYLLAYNFAVGLE